MDSCDCANSYLASVYGISSPCIGCSCINARASRYGHPAAEDISDKRSASVKENDSSPAKPQIIQLTLW